MDKQGQINLNKFLADKYGLFHEQPRFRVIWSTDEQEWRHGEFANEVMGLYLGTTVDTRKVPKYSYAMDRWVLEELVYSKYTPTELVNQGPVAYEPLWIFWTGEDNAYVEPSLSMVDQMCHYRVNNTLRGHAPTEEDLKKKKEKLERQNRARLREKIDEAIPDTANAILHGEGVFMDSRKVLH